MNGKWKMDCLYIAPLSKALYNLCLSFTHSHTHSHTNGNGMSPPFIFKERRLFTPARHAGIAGDARQAGGTTRRTERCTITAVNCATFKMFISQSSVKGHCLIIAASAFPDTIDARHGRRGRGFAL